MILSPELSRLLLAAKRGAISPGSFYDAVQAASIGHSRLGSRLYPGKLEIYRTRTFRPGYRPITVKELSYPPKKYSQAGRASVAGEQVFYASLGLPTTLAEVRATDGDFIIVGRWRNSTDCWLQRVGLDPAVDPLEEFFRQLFCTDDERMYPYSAALARQLANTEEIAGVAYPSIANQDESVNLALKRAYVDASIRFVEATCLRVVKVLPNKKYNVEQVDYARREDGQRLRWRGHGKRWTMSYVGQELHFEANGWDWAATDENGCPVLPD